MKTKITEKTKNEVLEYMKNFENKDVNEFFKINNHNVHIYNLGKNICSTIYEKQKFGFLNIYKHSEELVLSEKEN